MSACALACVDELDRVASTTASASEGNVTNRAAAPSRLALVCASLPRMASASGPKAAANWRAPFSTKRSA